MTIIRSTAPCCCTHHYFAAKERERYLTLEQISTYDHPKCPPLQETS